jgi:hypothetical protein
MNKSDIELTSEESEVFAQINLDPHALKGFEDSQQNANLVEFLMESLIDRKAIPDVRISFFTNPEYNSGGRGKSRQEIFENNGTKGKAIFRHAHFLRHLRYFVCGPNLPPGLIAGFRAEVENCGNITSGDTPTLVNYAKQQTKAQGLEPKKAAEEFYKLALDCGLDTYYADAVQKSVQKMR